MMTHVLLPESFALNLQLKDDASGKVLGNSLVGNEKWETSEKVIPGPHSYDGSYSEIITE